MPVSSWATGDAIEEEVPSGRTMEGNIVHSKGEWEGIDLGGVGVFNVRPVNVMCLRTPWWYLH